MCVGAQQCFGRGLMLAPMRAMTFHEVESAVRRDVASWHFKIMQANVAAAGH